MCCMEGARGELGRSIDIKVLVQFPCGDLDLEFVPFVERVAQTDLKLIYSEVHQMFGRYAGVITCDNGELIAVKDLIGFAEEHHARW